MKLRRARLGGTVSGGCAKDDVDTHGSMQLKALDQAHHQMNHISHLLHQWHSTCAGVPKGGYLCA